MMMMALAQLTAPACMHPSFRPAVRITGPIMRMTLRPQMMCPVPATLEFSGFRGYFVVLDDGGGEFEIPKERIGKGLQLGDRVVFDADAMPAQPLVITVADSAAEAARAEASARAAQEANEAAETAKAAKAAEAAEKAEAAEAVAIASKATEAAARAEVEATARRKIALDAATAVRDPGRREVAAAFGLASVAALVASYFATTTEPSAPSQPSAELVAARAEIESKRAAARAAAAQASKQAEEARQAAADAAATRAVEAAKASAMARETAEAETKAAAAAFVEEDAAIRASWTVQWSTAGEFEYFLNTRTCATAYREPVPGVLTQASLAEAKEAAMRADAEDASSPLLPQNRGGATQCRALVAKGRGR